MLDYNLANLVLILLMFTSLEKPVYKLRRTSNNDVIAAVLGRSFCFITSTSHAIISELDLKRNFTRRNFLLCPSRCKNYEPSPALEKVPTTL